MAIFRVGIFRVGVILGGYFPGGSYAGWLFSGLELSGWELSWVGIFLGWNFPSGNCRVGITRVAIFRVGDFMLPLKRIFLRLLRKYKGKQLALLIKSAKAFYLLFWITSFKEQLWTTTLIETDFIHQNYILIYVYLYLSKGKLGIVCYMKEKERFFHLYSSFISSSSIAITITSLCINFLIFLLLSKLCENWLIIENDRNIIKILQMIFIIHLNIPINIRRTEESVFIFVIVFMFHNRQNSIKTSIKSVCKVSSVCRLFTLPKIFGLIAGLLTTNNKFLSAILSFF